MEVDTFFVPGTKSEARDAQVVVPSWTRLPSQMPGSSILRVSLYTVAEMDKWINLKV